MKYKPACPDQSHLRRLNATGVYGGLMDQSFSSYLSLMYLFCRDPDFEIAVALLQLFKYFFANNIAF